ncbi:galactose mutarotase [Frigidibacter albus]|uniref:Aldose 1-epimerase n=1 Tax=Frigidibacter albus TaxID=1465486 RepID=A0A6L8VGY0_9RHOB|nr:aldose epimerase family protein [Frigidibacter albus]MZQ89483.1 galactose mutarotase [Frigidibacter albus]NBE31389.1 galactose mutarotase [Frigidibacter albus]GGH54388.1 aldose 1-epimerase [Frigidibacter albus]
MTARSERIFGHLDGAPVPEVVLAAGPLRARLIPYGARLVALAVPDRDGTLADVVLGFDGIEGYLASDAYLGATCGRVANRIAGGRFRLNGTDHRVDCNERGNHLHGGSAGFDRKLWQVEDRTGTSVTFTAESADGEMGYPGRCTLRVTYRLSATALSVVMEAQSDRPTVMNMAHHSYFNMAGAGTVLDQRLTVPAAFYTPVGPGLLTTGEILSVEGTPFDLRTGPRIGEVVQAMASAGIAPHGPDHNFCLPQGSGRGSGGLHLAAVLEDPASGRRMEVATTEPGLQVYAGGMLPEGTSAKAGSRLMRHAGIALESQAFPGAPSHAHFPNCRLMPGETYRHETRFTFSAS